MKTYVLDTSALLALRDEEPGADRVAEMFGLAQASNCVCLSSFISLMELMYRVWRDDGEALAQLAYDQCLALPMTWIHESPELLKAAAKKLGAKVTNVYWTLGEYDGLLILEAPDDETATTVLLHLAALGNVHTTTVRAFTAAEMDKIVAKVHVG